MRPQYHENMSEPNIQYPPDAHMYYHPTYYYSPPVGQGNRPIRPNYYPRPSYYPHENTRRESLDSSGMHQQPATTGNESQTEVPEDEEQQENIQDQGKSDKFKWSPAQDVDLCKSWLTISTDGVTGTDQSMNNFWEKIVNYYNEWRKEG